MNVLSSFNRDYRADLMHFAGPSAPSYGSIFNYSLPLRGAQNPELPAIIQIHF